MLVKSASDPVRTMIIVWQFVNPTKITFGAGSLDQIGTVISNANWCLVTYDDTRFAEMGDRISALAGAPVCTISNIIPNPNFQSLSKSCKEFASSHTPIDLVVALGGGSVIDTAKVIAATAGDFSMVRRYLETGIGDLDPLPIVAVPTTSGTGSEVTPWATVWDADVRRKYSLNHPQLFPRHALIDPVLMLSAPRDLTVSTGLDALSHALESIWNINANPISSSIAVQAASDILECLPILAQEPMNLRLRARMAKASVMAGVAFSNTKTALAHSLSYPITLAHGVPHGIACSFSLPIVMRWAAGHDHECDANLKRIFGSDLCAGAEQLSDFLEQLGVSTRHEDYGVSKTEWNEAIAVAFTADRGKNFIGRGPMNRQSNLAQP